MNLKENYFQKIVPELQKELNLKNSLAVPRVQKIKINVGIGSYLAGNKDYDPVVNNIAQITGQKPIVTKARIAISNFKLRADMPTGVTVTLRRNRMYDFLNKLINVVLPRLRDFRGLSKKSFDGHGNYSIGMPEFIVFPEIHPDDIVKTHGVQITIVTNAKDDESAYKLLKAMNFPFKKDTPPTPKTPKPEIPKAEPEDKPKDKPETEPEPNKAEANKAEADKVTPETAPEPTPETETSNS